MEKQAFVKQLYELVVQTPKWADMKGMEYVVDENGNEWLYIIYGPYTQHRININMDSTSSILEDFVKHPSEHDWLPSEQCINKE